MGTFGQMVGRPTKPDSRTSNNIRAQSRVDPIVGRSRARRPSSSVSRTLAGPDARLFEHVAVQAVRRLLDDGTGVGDRRQHDSLVAIRRSRSTYP